MKTEHTHIYQQIEDYLSGKLDEEQTDLLWAELLADGDAMDHLQTMAGLKQMAQEGEFSVSEQGQLVDSKATVSSSSSTLPVSSIASKPYAWKWLVAAIVLLMSVVGISYSILQQSGDTGAGAVALIEYDIFRSSEQQASLHPQIEEVMMLSAAGSHEQALSTLQEIMAGSGAGGLTELEMLQATLYYNAGDFNQALAVFSQLNTSDISGQKQEEVLWYSANTQLQLNNPEVASALLQQVIDLDGTYSRVAKNLLNDLKQ